MRVFVALDLPETFRLSLLDATAALRSARDDLRWEPAGKLHLTLAFIGETDEAGAGLVVEAARRTAGKTAGFALTAARLLAFPRRGAARVVAAGTAAGSRECAEAASLFEDELEALGREAGRAKRERERRPFSPHVTLARSGRFPARLTEDEAHTALSASCRIERISVYESAADRGGARYAALAAFPLVRDSSTKCPDRGIAR